MAIPLEKRRTIFNNGIPNPTKIRLDYESTLTNVNKPFTPKPIASQKSPFARLAGAQSGQQPQLARAQEFIPPLPSIIELRTPNYEEKGKGIVEIADSRGYTTAMPFITHNVGGGYLPTFYDDMFIRGGVLLSTQRAAEDVLRIGKFYATGKGLLWNIREAGLQLTNPRPETRFFNPATLLLNVGTQHTGIRWPRHGLNPFSQGIGGSLIDPTGYNTYSTITDYKASGWDFSINDFVPVPRTIPKLDQMKMASFGADGSTTKDLIAHALKSPLSFLGNGVVTYTAPSDKAGGSAPFWPISYLGRVHSTYGLNLLDRTMNRVVNTQWNQYGQSTHENVPGQDSTMKGISADSILNQVRDVAGASTPAGDVLTRYKTLSYQQLGTEDDKYYSTSRDTLTGPASNYSYSPKLSRRRSSKRSDAVINRGFADSGNTDSDTIVDKINRTGFLTGKEESDWTNEQLGKELDDLIPFLFYDVHDKTFLVFRATITQLTDTITPNWNEYKYVGNPLSYYTYTGTTREVSFTFTVYTNGETELKSNWIKLSRLVGMTYPSYSNEGRMISPFVKLTIGDVYHRVPGFINSLTLTVDDNTPWEINLFKNKELLRAPHVVEAQVTFTYVGDYLPRKTTPHFAQGKYELESWNTRFTGGYNVTDLVPTIGEQRQNFPTPMAPSAPPIPSNPLP